MSLMFPGTGNVVTLYTTAAAGTKRHRDHRSGIAVHETTRKASRHLIVYESNNRTGNKGNLQFHCMVCWTERAVGVYSSFTRTMSEKGRDNGFHCCCIVAGLRCGDCEFLGVVGLRQWEGKSSS